MKRTAVLARQSGSPALKRATGWPSYVQSTAIVYLKTASAGWSYPHGAMSCSSPMRKRRSMSPENR
jgi:hypothetical protein